MIADNRTFTVSSRRRGVNDTSTTEATYYDEVREYHDSSSCNCCFIAYGSGAPAEEPAPLPPPRRGPAERRIYGGRWKIRRAAPVPLPLQIRANPGARDRRRNVRKRFVQSLRRV